MDRRFILYSPLKSWGIPLCLKGSSISYFEAVMLHNVFKKKLEDIIVRPFIILLSLVSTCPWDGVWPIDHRLAIQLDSKDLD